MGTLTTVAKMDCPCARCTRLRAEGRFEERGGGRAVYAENGVSPAELLSPNRRMRRANAKRSRTTRGRR